MSDNIDTRNKLLYQDNFNKLESLKVAIIGLGGVGSIIPLSLIRAGVSNLLLIDKDKVEITNLNRQIAYDLNDIGIDKTLALKSKCLNLRSNANILTKEVLIDEHYDFNELNEYDYIVDAIDDIKAKLLLINYCLENNKKIVVSLGTGKKYKPSELTLTTLDKTYEDRLAKKLRYELRKKNLDLKKITCVFSKERNKVIFNKENSIIPSSVFVPNSAGLLIASFIINDYLTIF